MQTRSLLAFSLGLTIGAAVIPAYAQSDDDLIRQLRAKSGSQLIAAPTGGLRLPVGAAPVHQPSARDPGPNHLVSSGAGQVHRQSSPEQTMTQSDPCALGGQICKRIEFATGSAALTPNAEKSLAQLGRVLNNPELKGLRFRIEGHTDTVGTAEYNRELSEQRAVSVAKYLESKFGVPADRLAVEGKGFDQPAVQTGPGMPEARNRRVQVVRLDS